MLIPENILQQLKFHCEASGLGMQVIMTESIFIICGGHNDLPPNDVAVYAAYGLLRGVTSGAFDAMNDITKLQQEQENKGEKKH